MQHEFVARFPNRQHARSHSILRAEWIGAARDALRDRDTAEGSALLQLFPITVPTEGCRGGQLRSVQQSWRKVQQAEWRFRNFAFRNSGRAQDQRHVNQFLHQARWRMITPAMIEELLSMIGGQSEDAVVPPVRALQRLDQASHLRIDPTNG